MRPHGGGGRGAAAALLLLAAAAMAPGRTAAQEDGGGGGGGTEGPPVGPPAMHWFPDGWLPYGKSCEDADPATRRLPLEALRFDSWAPASVLSPAPRQLLVVGLRRYTSTGRVEGRGDVLWTGDGGRSWFCVSAARTGASPPSMSNPGGSAWLVGAPHADGGGCPALCVTSGRVGLITDGQGAPSQYLGTDTAVFCAALAVPPSPGAPPPELLWAKEPEPLPAMALGQTVVMVPLPLHTESASASPSSEPRSLTLLVGGNRASGLDGTPLGADDTSSGVDALWLMRTDGSGGGPACTPGAPLGVTWVPLPVNHSGATRALDFKRQLVAWLQPDRPAASAGDDDGAPLGRLLFSGGQATLDGTNPLARLESVDVNPDTGGAWSDTPLVDSLMVELPAVPVASASASASGSASGSGTASPTASGSPAASPTATQSASSTPPPMDAPREPSPVAGDAPGGRRQLHGQARSVRGAAHGGATSQRRLQAAGVTIESATAALSSLAVPLRTAPHPLQLPRPRPAEPLGAAYSLAVVPRGAASALAFDGGLLLPDSSSPANAAAYPAQGDAARAATTQEELDGAAQTSWTGAAAAASSFIDSCGDSGRCAIAVLSAGSDVYVGGASTPAVGFASPPLVRVTRHVVYLDGGNATAAGGDNCTAPGGACANATTAGDSGGAAELLELSRAPGDAVGLQLWHQQAMTATDALDAVAEAAMSGGMDAAARVAAAVAVAPFGHLLVADAATGRLWRGTFTACSPVLPCREGHYLAGCGVHGPLDGRCAPCPTDSHAPQCDPGPTTNGNEGGGGVVVDGPSATPAALPRLTGALSTQSAVTAWIALTCEALAGGVLLLLLLLSCGAGATRAAAAAAAVSSGTSSGKVVRSGGGGSSPRDCSCGAGQWLPPGGGGAGAGEMAELLLALVATTAALPFAGAGATSGYTDVRVVAALLVALLALRPVLALARGGAWLLRHRAGGVTASDGKSGAPAASPSSQPAASVVARAVAALLLRPVLLVLPQPPPGGGVGAVAGGAAVRSGSGAGTHPRAFKPLLPPAAYAALFDIPLTCVAGVLASWATAVPASPVAGARTATAGLAWVALLAQAALAARTLTVAAADAARCSDRLCGARRRGGRRVSAWETQPALAALEAPGGYSLAAGGGGPVGLPAGSGATVYAGNNAALAAAAAVPAADRPEQQLRLHAGADAAFSAADGGAVAATSTNPLLRAQWHALAHAGPAAAAGSTAGAVAAGPAAPPDGGGSGGFVPTADGLWRLAVTEEGARLADQVIFFRAYPQLVPAAAEAVASDPLPAPWVRLLRQLEGGGRGGRHVSGSRPQRADSGTDGGRDVSLSPPSLSPSMAGDADAVNDHGAGSFGEADGRGDNEGDDNSSDASVGAGGAAAAAARLMTALGLPPLPAAAAAVAAVWPHDEDDGVERDDDVASTAGH